MEKLRFLRNRVAFSRGKNTLYETTRPLTTPREDLINFHGRGPGWKFVKILEKPRESADRRSLSKAKTLLLICKELCLVPFIDYHRIETPRTRYASLRRVAPSAVHGPTGGSINKSTTSDESVVERAPRAISSEPMYHADRAGINL